MEEDYKHLSIKLLAEDDRPREKLLNNGRHTLSDAELLAIIMASGNKNETALQLAQRMLKENNNNLNDLAKLSINDLKKYRGVGEVKAITIAAVFELGRRRTDTISFDKLEVRTSNAAYQILQKRLSDLPHEEFWVLLLTRNLKLIKDVCISKGGIAGTVVDVRIVCKLALEHNASALIIAHNHPSGNLQPSEADEKITKQIKQALNLFDISLNDHIIIGDQDYFSFNDSGKL